MAPKRFIAKRGQRLQSGQKLVGRNTRWGNPFALAMHINPDRPPRLVLHYAEKWGVAIDSLICDSPEKAVRRYREALVRQKLDYGVADVRELLGGFDLGCPCGLPACHAEVLLELANS